MKNLNDTTAAIATTISGSSAIVTFMETYNPVITFFVGMLGIVSGILAIMYYVKKIKKLNGKG